MEKGMKLEDIGIGRDLHLYITNALLETVEGKYWVILFEWVFKHRGSQKVFGGF
jgi:hypothetical protein